MSATTEPTTVLSVRVPESFAKQYDALAVNSSEEVSMNYSDGATQHPDRVPAILRVQAPLSPLCGGPETCCLPR